MSAASAGGVRAVILAAGRGKRMGALTGQQPKCLTPLAGKSLLRWQLDALRDADISRVAIVRGYLGHLLAEEGCDLFENSRWAETNMVTSLTCAASWLESGPCIVCYADIVFHPDAIRRLMEGQGDLVVTYDRLWLALWSARFDSPLSDAETFRVGPDGCVQDIGRRPTCLEEIEGQYMGLLKITPVGWRQIREVVSRAGDSERDSMDMTSLLRRLLDAGIGVRAVPVDGRWCEVDSEADLNLYRRQLGTRDAWLHDWR